MGKEFAPAVTHLLRMKLASRHSVPQRVNPDAIRMSKLAGITAKESGCGYGGTKMELGLVRLNS
jgi:hypothetical protein